MRQKLYELWGLETGQPLLAKFNELSW